MLLPARCCGLRIGACCTVVVPAAVPHLRSLGLHLLVGRRVPLPVLFVLYSWSLLGVGVPAPVVTIGSRSTPGVAATTSTLPVWLAPSPSFSEALDRGGSPISGHSSSSSMSLSSDSLSTSSGVTGRAKFYTVGRCLARFLPASHAKASPCHRSRTSIHSQSQYLVKCPVFPVGRVRSTLAGIFHDGKCAAYLAACQGVRHYAHIVRACMDPPSALKQSAPILFHGCHPERLHPVPLNISYCTFRSESVPPGRNRASS